MPSMTSLTQRHLAQATQTLRSAEHLPECHPVPQMNLKSHTTSSPFWTYSIVQWWYLWIWLTNYRLQANQTRSHTQTQLSDKPASEQILNGTSAQLGYIVPFTLVHVGKCRTEDKVKILRIQKLNTTQKKQTMQNTPKQNYPGSVASYNTWPRNEVGLFCNGPEPTGANDKPTTYH